MTTGNKVAVIGLGALGLVALKNCVEEGFEVRGFERNSYVGGLWKYTTEDKTSVLPTTIINFSKERGCFTDFPFSKDTPTHCSATDVEKYLESYAEHFKLHQFMRFNTTVTRVYRDDGLNKWVVCIENSPDEIFDRIIMATGSNQTPNYPVIKGIELFKGEQVHSKTYKGPESFKDKDVLIIGLGNSGADTAVSLVGHANKIYASHREGVLIIPRSKNGRPIDHTINVRFIRIQGILDRFLPSLAEKLFNAFAKKLQDDAFTIRPEWKLSPAPSLKFSIPIVSDEIVPVLESGEVETVVGIRQVVGPNEVELTDGKVLAVDSILYCTGYKPNFGLLDAKDDPTAKTVSEWAAAKGSRGKPLPRLYQNVFSLEHPQSLAFMGCVAFATGAFQLYDIASMAVAQIWKGNSELPPQEEMERAVEMHHAHMIDLARQGNVHPQMVNASEWMPWAGRMAGCGVDEYLGWGWKGLKFWFREPRLCGMLMGGIYSPHIYRYFDGKRKKWDGAREEIERLNKMDSQKAKLN